MTRNAIYSLHMLLLGSYDQIPGGHKLEKKIYLFKFTMSEIIPYGQGAHCRTK